MKRLDAAEVALGTAWPSESLCGDHLCRMSLMCSTIGILRRYCVYCLYVCMYVKSCVRACETAELYTEGILPPHPIRYCSLSSNVQIQSELRS